MRKILSSLIVLCVLAHALPLSAQAYQLTESALKNSKTALQAVVDQSSLPGKKLYQEAYDFFSDIDNAKTFGGREEAIHLYLAYDAFETMNLPYVNEKLLIRKVFFKTAELKDAPPVYLERDKGIAKVIPAYLNHYKGIAKLIMSDILNRMLGGGHVKLSEKELAQYRSFAERFMTLLGFGLTTDEAKRSLSEGTDETKRSLRKAIDEAKRGLREAIDSVMEFKFASLAAKEVVQDLTSSMEGVGGSNTEVFNELLADLKKVEDGEMTEEELKAKVERLNSERAASYNFSKLEDGTPHKHGRLTEKEKDLFADISIEMTKKGSKTEFLHNFFLSLNSNGRLAFKYPWTTADAPAQPTTDLMRAVLYLGRTSHSRELQGSVSIFKTILWSAYMMEHHDSGVEEDASRPHGLGVADEEKFIKHTAEFIKAMLERDEFAPDEDKQFQAGYAAETLLEWFGTDGNWKGRVVAEVQSTTNSSSDSKDVGTPTDPDTAVPSTPNAQGEYTLTASALGLIKSQLDIVEDEAPIKELYQGAYDFFGKINEEYLFKDLEDSAMLYLAYEAVNRSAEQGTADDRAFN